MLLLQGCVAINAYPEQWPALQRDRIIHSPPPDGPRSITACPYIAGEYANEGSRFPIDAKPLRLIDFFPLEVVDVPQAVSVRIDQTESTLGVTVLREDGVIATTTFNKTTTGSLGPDEYRCLYDVTTKDRGISFLRRPAMQESVGGAVFVLAVDTKVVWMQTAVDRSLVVRKVHSVGTLLPLPLVAQTFNHYRFAAVDPLQ